MNTKAKFLAGLLLAAIAVVGWADDEGLLIGGIVEDSPAEKAGLLRGDILLEIDGNEINSPNELQELLEDYKAGQRVRLSIIRGGEEKQIHLNLEDRLFRPIIGIEFASRFPRFEFGFGRNFGPRFEFGPRMGIGVIISEVVEGSPADVAGLEARDAIISVDGEQVPPEEFKKIIESHEPGDRIVLEISRPGEDGDEPFEVPVRLGSNDDGGAFLGIRFVYPGVQLHFGPEMRERFERIERGFRERLEDRRGRMGPIFIPKEDERSEL